jgi:hypothetical protein
LQTNTRRLPAPSALSSKFKLCLTSCMRSYRVHE